MNSKNSNYPILFEKDKSEILFIHNGIINITKINSIKKIFIKKERTYFYDWMYFIVWTITYCTLYSQGYSISYWYFVIVSCLQLIIYFKRTFNYKIILVKKNDVMYKIKLRRKHKEDMKKITVEIIKEIIQYNKENKLRTATNH